MRMPHNMKMTDIHSSPSGVLTHTLLTLQAVRRRRLQNIPEEHSIPDQATSIAFLHENPPGFDDWLVGDAETSMS